MAITNNRRFEMKYLFFLSNEFVIIRVKKGSYQQMEVMFFDFFNKEYSEDQVITRANEYCEIVDKAYELLKSKTKADHDRAFKLFKTMNQCIRFESDEYRKRIYTEIPKEYATYNQYIWAVGDIRGHLINTNSKAKLSSNLYDIRFYFRYYLKEKIREED